MTMAQHTIDVDGIPVGYYVQGEGNGTPLVLVHGGTGHPETSFAGLLDEFTAQRRTVIPGYSGSTLTPLPAEGKVDVDMLADQVLAAARDAVGGPVDLFGISTGAVVAAAAAGRSPERVRRMVLLGGFVHYRRPWQRLLARTWRKLAEVDANAFAEYTLMHVLSDEFIDAMRPPERLSLRAGLAPTEGMVALVDFVSEVDISHYVDRITAPTLIVGMTRDQLVPVRYAREFHAAIPGSAYVEIDSGHAAATEKPDELSKVVREFLA
ncbi:alpha/beta hydrolase [Streptomyces tremellae]|uniref:Alpha/beta fold hydrolase n=1 Tax=Streptomyces tremellae TaxID=1124239 RepID=A0ABP7EN69_9ACTN